MTDWLSTIASASVGRGDVKNLVAAARRRRLGIRSFVTPGDDPAFEMTERIRLGDPFELQKAELVLRVESAQLTPRELECGSQPPNEIARQNARRCVVDLFEAYQLQPQRITASVEGGVFFAYRSDGGTCLDIEIDNEGDMIGVLSDAENVIRTEVLDIPAKTNRLVHEFRQHS